MHSVKDILLFLLQSGEEVQPHNLDSHCIVQSHPSVEMTGEVCIYYIYSLLRNKNVQLVPTMFIW